MDTLGVHRALYCRGGDFSGGLGDCGGLLRPKVIRNHQGHYEFLLSLGTRVGTGHYRRDLRPLSQLCPDDVRLYHSFSDRKLSLRLARKAASAFPLGRAAV